MDERIRIIADGLKGLNNSAVELIRNGQYDEAEKMFETVENTSKLFRYDEGVGMARMSLANLSVMRGRLTEALIRVDAAAECYPPGGGKDAACELRGKIVIIALDMGIKKEKAGDLTGALELFEGILPYLNQKRAAAVSKEIAHIREHLAKTGTADIG